MPDTTQRDANGAQCHRRLDLAELRNTRLRLLREAYRRGGDHTAVLFDTEFLGDADKPTVMEAILRAALTSGGADFCDLQVHDRQEGALRIRAQHGFRPAFLSFFASITTGHPTACAKALVTRAPVLVDDVTRSPIFVGQPTLDPILDAGTRSVASYPLMDGGPEPLGVLSLHYSRPGFGRGVPELVVLGAATALKHFPPDGDGPGHWYDFTL
ncbi:GAF domain-containing protein [Saccharopolyspora spinosa]|uniref:GAF domain-containing protein n=1 Tax=Saccharopolyspora spinosa TaxID=60894 RepID=A0A2N3XVP6_SACSN|nr:GAF domain-containing protein [Saccharopolyspora spinosa]PKW14725.1 GAF domain-containing protein [Saccharopolyspora spinosa]